MTLAAPLVALLLAAPASAQQAEQPAGQSRDTTVAAQLERATAHFQQMLRTLRQNPSLEEDWTTPSVLDGTVGTGRRSTALARDLARLSAHLDSLLEGEAGRGNAAFAEHTRRIRGDAQEMVSSLRSIARELESLRSVVHGGEGGAALGHPARGGAERHVHGAGAAGHHAGLHFSHPLVAESVSPDTKVRFNYNNRQLDEEETENTLGLTAEYAFDRTLSVEASSPYSLTDDAFGFTHVSLKFANYAFEEQGVSLGYGVGAELPTSGDAPEEEGEEANGSDRDGRVAGVASRAPAPRFSGGGGVHGTLGEDFVELEPFFNVGWKTGRWELVSFATFGVPSGAGAGEVGTELAWNFSALYQVVPEVQALLEFDGTSGLSGEPVGEDVVNVSPGVKVRPLASSPLFLGLGGSLPITEDEGFEDRIFVSLFYHFR